MNRSPRFKPMLGTLAFAVGLFLLAALLVLAVQDGISRAAPVGGPAGYAERALAAAEKGGAQ